MDSIYLVCLALITVFAIAGILSRYFDDNLPQRIGLSLIGFSTFIEIWQNLNVLACYQMESVRQLSVFGFVIYGIGTFIKVYRYRHH